MEQTAKVVATLKAGRDFDAPWLVFHGASSDEVEAEIQNAMNSDLMALMGRAAKEFSATTTVGSTLGGTIVSSTPPAALTGGAPAGATKLVFTDSPFEKKDEIKAMGGRWDKIGKTWYLEAATANASGLSPESLSTRGLGPVSWQ